MELMSISVYISVTGTFIIVCYNKKQREKDGGSEGVRESEREKRDKREGER